MIMTPPYRTIFQLTLYVNCSENLKNTLHIFADIVVNSKSTFWNLIDFGGNLLGWLRERAKEMASASLYDVMGRKPCRAALSKCSVLEVRVVRLG